MKKLRIIGDVHQEYAKYIALTESCDYSLQLGDMGFNYDPIRKLDGNKHKHFFGNHDNRDANPAPGYIGGFGTYEINGIPFFFIDGGFSIDYKYRQEYERVKGVKTWWEDEELSHDAMCLALEWYKETKPELMITHECPSQIAKIIGKPDVLRNFGFDPNTFTTRTSELLQACFEAYQPTLWVFGHYHNYQDLTQGRTRFICLDQLGYHSPCININERLELC